MCARMILFLLLSLALLPIVPSLNNGLALTPPMGFLTWVRFQCNTDCDTYPDECIGERMLKLQADALVANGYLDVGYEYVAVDDCWPAKERDAQGRLQPDPKRFPSGIKNLARYMHSKGLKLGIYQDVGTMTCAGYPGTQGHWEIDAQTLADWEVDMLKLDGCHSDPEHWNVGYPAMAKYLNETGRPIMYSCEWPIYDRSRGIKPNYTAVAETCNTFRVSSDMQDSYEFIEHIINFYGNDTGGFSKVAGPGHFCDANQLTIGSNGLSYDEERVVMGMWAIFASPLLMSVDLRTVPARSKALLQNLRVLAINQDPLGIQGRRVLNLENGLLQLWTRPIKPQGSYAIAVWNNNHQGIPIKFSFLLKQVGLEHPAGYDFMEVFDGDALGHYSPGQNFTCTVNPSGLYMVKATVTDFRNNVGIMTL